MSSDFNKNRIEALDRLKGMAIILVVVGHLIQIYYQPYNFDKNIVFSLIYTFHMALFFYLAGVVHKLKQFSEELITVSKRLLLPFILFYLIVNCKFDIGFFCESIGNYFLDPQLGFWFLIVLSVIRVSVNTFILINDKHRFLSYIATLIFFIAAFMLKKKFSMHYVIFYTPFFVLGYILKEETKKIIETPDFNKLTFIAIFIYLIIYTEAHQRNLLDMNFILFSLQKFLLAVLGIYIFVQVISKIRFTAINSLLSFIGKRTLFIYGLHSLFLPLYSHIGFIAVIPIVVFPVLLNMVYDYFNSKIFFLMKRGFE